MTINHLSYQETGITSRAKTKILGRRNDTSRDKNKLKICCEVAVSEKKCNEMKRQ